MYSVLSSDITPSLTSCMGMRASGRPRAAVRKIPGRKREGGREGGEAVKELCDCDVHWIKSIAIHAHTQRTTFLREGRG